MKFKLIILIILLMFMNGCGYDKYEMPKDIYINLNDNIFSVYEEHTSYELIKDSNMEILSADSILNTNTVGKYVYTLEYTVGKRKYMYDITYEVIDNTPPIFISASSTINVLVNEKDNLCNKIVYGDNYDNLPNCLVIGDYDLSKVGNYNNLEFIINDAAGNENRKKFSLNVVNEIENKTGYSNPRYIYMNDIIDKYKNDDTSIGIDISKWQGNIDFEKIKKAGVEFVIMRIGVQGDANEDILVDSRFNEYYKKAKDVGLKISVYVYNTAISWDDGIKTAKWVIKMLDGDKLDFPIAYDWENWKNFNNYNISLHTLSDAYLSFEKTLKENGYDSMLYSSKFYLENVWMNYDKSNVWLAHYTDKTDYQGNYMMWQMTSLGKIDGITENTVDIDILYKK